MDTIIVFTFKFPLSRRLARCLRPSRRLIVDQMNDGLTGQMMGQCGRTATHRLARRLLVRPKCQYLLIAVTMKFSGSHVVNVYTRVRVMVMIKVSFRVRISDRIRIRVTERIA